MLIDETRLRQIISEITREFDIFAPYMENDHFYMGQFVPEGTMSLSGCRPTEPLKTLLYPPREQLLPPATVTKKKMFIGVRNCDLAALCLLDRALLHAPDFVDPAYRAERDLTYIVALDCTDPLPTCHCDLVDLKPYPEACFDLALSPVGAGFLLSAATAKGEEIAALFSADTTPAGESGSRLTEEVKKNRERTMAQLAGQNSRFRKYCFGDSGGSDESWTGFSGKCVECGGCSYICPTCYCIIVNDETRDSTDFRKVRAWDSCQHTGYARVAGGATPRPRLWQRFRHRYHCKFRIMNDNFSRSGCTGCGRCIEACPAGIDLREIVSGQQVV